MKLSRADVPVASPQGDSDPPIIPVVNHIVTKGHPGQPPESLHIGQDIFGYQVTASMVPPTALDVLVYAAVACGANNQSPGGGGTLTTIKISAEWPDSRVGDPYFLLDFLLYENSAWVTNSDNVWLPAPETRPFKIKFVIQQPSVGPGLPTIDGQVMVALGVIGYR